MKNTFINRAVAWIDSYLLIILASVLLALIPLYPKLPLFDIIPGYLVRVRIEDFAVLLTFVFWGIQVLRKKIEWKTPLAIPIALYAVAGLLAVLSAIVFTKTVPAELIHIGKTGLHYFRYLEYFSLYFILANAVKTKRHLKIVLGVLSITLIAITVYGIGQKYWYWPVYSTMNREFAKGIRLVLTEHARVQSTFGGHYDLGGYLVIVLPVILSLILVSKKYWRLLFATAYLGGMWLLFVSASRTSLIAYLVASGIVILWHSIRKSSWQQKTASLLRYSLMFLLIHAIFLRSFGDDLFERVEQTINSFPAVAAPYNQSMNIIDMSLERTAEAGRNTLDFVMRRNASDDLANALKVEKPKDSITIDEVLVASDARPEPAVPVDVYADLPIYTQVATTSADGTTTYTTIEKERQYSENALRYGLSTAIRLDTLWPRALAGFYRNPVLGSGYATLTKDSVIHFTEAESTDNNFLRTLGETGALGFITFYGVIMLAITAAWKIIKQFSPATFEASYAVGYIAAAAGILINATFIDVFAASKVAFYFWALTGILLAIYMQKRNLPNPAAQGKRSKNRRT